MQNIRSLTRVQLDEAKNRLFEKFLGVEPTLENSRHILSVCIEEFGGLFASHTTGTSEPRRKYFFRARKAHTFSNQDEMDDSKQHSYPPPGKCLLGRANIAGYPVFYGSDSPDTAISEVRNGDENKFLLSIWHTEVIHSSQLNFLFASNIEGSRLINFRESCIKEIHEKYSEYNDLSKERMKWHLLAWSDLFLSDNYALSAAIAHCNLYGKYASREVLAYGSSINGRFVNYAIHPLFADKLILYRVYSVISESDNTQLGYIQVGEPENGSLKWRKIRQEDLPENDPFLPTSFI